ncbi:MAG: hypothetical protein KGI51_02155 [Rhodospirillales bacterium]|nr:hypothetical protein [Rhodospirillales bacterium]
MTDSDKPHLVERAAELLMRSGGGGEGLAELAAPSAAVPAAASEERAPTPSWDRAATLIAPPLLAPAPVPAAEQLPEPARKIDMPRLIAAGLAEGGAGRTRIAEEFRLVQNQLLRSAFGADAEPGLSNLLMVTSARPNEGKTFSAFNLAASIARRGDHRVLLIDADAKHGSLSDLLGINESPGLLELAARSDIGLGDCMFATAIPALSFLPVGHQRGHRGDIFASNGMMRVIQGLGRRFPDLLIVLDVAPCLSTSDPAALAPMVGQVVFVVEAERTQRDEVEASLDLIQTCPTITLLLNKVQMSTSHSFGAYSYSYAS